ncbi:MAG: precorrin-6y C5,15-methyltransferase (decarboxylating) subunit CbiE [Nitrospirae bacterium]|nr:precorrin-6y C5,15-methyltransferase (decarboxylating) subunit CbiE [Nitrospirota bacterium]
MNKFFVIGIGYRPLPEKASYIIRRSDTILATERLFEVFKRCAEFSDVKDRVKVAKDIHETMEHIRANYKNKKISVLADGDPMFFGFGRMAVKEFGGEAVEIFPDISCVQAAFSRIKESWGDAFLMSLHGGPDPNKRMELEYEADDIPKLLDAYDKIAVLTDKVNNPVVIANKLSAVSGRLSGLTIFVCERLGYPDEKITKGAPKNISEGSFSFPNLVIILKEGTPLP